MSAPSTTTRSLSSIRARTLALRALAYGLVAILCIAGLRAILAKPTAATSTRTVVRAGDDVGAQAYAESFVRAYLTWDAAHPEGRQRRLATFGAAWIGDDAGLTPAEGSTQEVRWTAIVGSRKDAGDRRVITIAADTTTGLRYVSVPIRRDRRGFIGLAGYPALVGPPAVAKATTPPREASDDDLQDTQLGAVARRAVGNYVSGAKTNLLADLAPDAVVSLPGQPMRLTELNSATWVEPKRRVAVEVIARDAQGNAWTLRYELDVVRRDRWYVRSIEVDPTFPDQEGGP
jgi:Conjugative transposon protein TcpC